MASMDTLINRVIDKVKADEEAKFEVAKKLQAQELAIEQEKIERQEAVASENVKRRVDDEGQRKEQSYINTLRNDRLQEKQNLLASVYAQAAESLSGLSVEKFADLVCGALQQLSNSDATELVIGEKSQSQLNQAAFKGLKKEFPQLSIKHDVLRGEGGFILSQKGMDYNFTFNKLISENKDTFASELTRKAF